MKYATLALIAALAATQPALAEPQKVDAFTFNRAETDVYFSNIIKRNGGLNVLVHDREPTPIDEQTIVRMNRDTFYSSSVHDLAAGPVKIVIPENPDGRFQSLQVISQDHYTPFVIYEGELELTEENVGTRYVMLAFRTFVDPSDEADIKAAHAAQDAMLVEQAEAGSFEVPEWDPETHATARDALSALQSLGGTDDKVRMGTAEEVDTVAHLMATATGWGLNPKSAAMYYTSYPDPEGKAEPMQIVLGDVPAEGFWSVSVYNKDGFFEENELGSYSLNNVTAQASEDGTTKIQFGDCGAETQNCIPITAGWNFSLRLYRPGPTALDGSWQPPELTALSE